MGVAKNYLKNYNDNLLFPSRVSGRGYKIGPISVCVCICVCLSVCL